MTINWTLRLAGDKKITKDYLEDLKKKMTQSLITIFESKEMRSLSTLYSLSRKKTSLKPR